MIYSSQIIVFHVYRYITLALTINFDAKILQIFDILSGQSSNFIFVKYLLYCV